MHITCYRCGQDMPLYGGCDVDDWQGELQKQADSNRAANDLKLTYFFIGVCVAAALAAIAGFTH